MFSDIKDQSLNKIPMSDAKAYPSVNSPNGGGFNSEENLRWLTKKLATKPFIVGANDDEVNNAFGSNGEAGDGIYTKPGMFSIDGYVFKFARPEEISFDNDGETTFMVMNTQMIQRFVQQLTNQGTSQAIVTDMTLFMFDDYNPSEYDLSDPSDIEALESKWKETYENGDCVGYIWNYYNGDYKDELTVSENKISYLTGDKIDYVNNSELYNNPTISSISTFLNGHSELNGKPFAIPNDTTTATSYAIFYPLYFKDVKKWNKDTSKYDTTQQIQFTDVFGLTLFYNTQICSSRTYPVTTSLFMDMLPNTVGGVKNVPFDALDFDNCDLNTYPNYFYDYWKMYTTETYNVGGETYTRPSIRPDPLTLDTTSTYVDIKESTTSKRPANISGILNQLDMRQGDLPSVAATSISTGCSIKNTLFYFCISGIGTDTDYPIFQNKDIVFMSSDGSLCPYGMRYTDSDSKETFGTDRVEGYLHACKRCYLYLTNQDYNDEELIQNVNVDQMLANSDFVVFYNKYIAPAISIYLHITYSSILEHLFFNNSDTETKRIKAMGSGNELAGVQDPSIDTNRTFYVNYTYTYDSYVRDSNSFVPRETLIEVHRDIDSDYNKSKRFVSGTATIESGGSGQPDLSYYTKPSALLDSTEYNKRLPYFIDDPINYLRKCLCSSTYVGHKIKTFVFSVINEGNVDTSKTFDITENNASVYMALDDYLVPKKSGNSSQILGSGKIIFNEQLCSYFDTHVMRSTGTTLQESSFINGLCAKWKQNCWFTEIPLTMRVDKDSLNYLKSKDFTDPNYYKGIIFEYKFPQDLLDTDLYLYNLIISTTNIMSDYDLETCTRQEDTTSSKVKHRRESFIHFNKLYGDNYISLEDFVDEKIDDVQNDIKQLQTNITTLNQNVTTLNQRVSARAKIVVSANWYIATTVSANNYIENEVDLSEIVDDIPSTHIWAIANRVQNNTNSYTQDFNPNLKIDTYFKRDTRTEPLTRKLVIRLSNTSGSDITFDVAHPFNILYTVLMQDTDN